MTSGRRNLTKMEKTNPFHDNQLLSKSEAISMIFTDIMTNSIEFLRFVIPRSDKISITFFLDMGEIFTECVKYIKIKSQKLKLRSVR